MKAKEILSNHPSQHTQADVEAARKWLESVKTIQNNGVFASFHKGKVAQAQTHGPCHGSIGSVAPYGPLVASLTKGLSNNGYGSSNSHLVKAAPEIAERWFTWLLYDTYWSPFYVDTTVDQAMHSGLLVPSTLPANLMQGCNIITRHNHEHPNSIRAWDALVQLGMEPDIAYLVVFCWGMTLATLDQNMPIQFIQLGHNAMGQLTPSVLRNFLNRDYNNLLKPMFGDLSQPYGLSSQIPYDQGERSSSYHGSYGITPTPEHILAFVKFLNSFNKQETTSEVVSPFAKRFPASTLIDGMPRPGGKVVKDNAKDIQEWLLKEFING